MANVDEDDYDDGNRAFLQAFMARSNMTFEEARPVLASIFTANGSPPHPYKREQTNFPVV